MELLWGLVAFLTAVGCHAALLRLPLRGDSVTKFALAGGLVGLVLGLVVLALSPTLAGLAGLVLYAFVCEVYTFLFTLVGSSVSVQILLTLRGGPATAAELDDPEGVAVDAAGDIFIADSFNNVIREVVESSTAATALGVPKGTIITVAGNGDLGYSGAGRPPTSAGFATRRFAGWGPRSMGWSRPPARSSRANSCCPGLSRRRRPPRSTWHSFSTTCG